MTRIKEKYRVYLDPNFTRLHLASGRRSAIEATLGRYQRSVDPENLVIEASVFKLRSEILKADVVSLTANDTELKLEAQRAWTISVASDSGDSYVASTKFIESRSVRLFVTTNEHDNVIAVLGIDVKNS